MTLTAGYLPVNERMSVPYLALSRIRNKAGAAIRRTNEGFNDLRGNPAAAAAIAEARASPALRNLLIWAAMPGSPILTLGCDIHERCERHYVSGGYVQIAATDYRSTAPQDYVDCADGIALALQRAADGHAWDLLFRLTPCEFALDDEPCLAASLCIAFEAMGPADSRETLVRLLHAALQDAPPRPRAARQIRLARARAWSRRRNGNGNAR